MCNNTPHVISLKEQKMRGDVGIRHKHRKYFWKTLIGTALFNKKKIGLAMQCLALMYQMHESYEFQKVMVEEKLKEIAAKGID